MKTMAEFKKYYDSDLLPLLREFESRRLKIKTTFLITAACAVVLGGGLAIVFLFLPILSIISVVVAIAVCAFTWMTLTKGFVQDFKGSVIAGIVRFCDENLSYAPTRSISQSKFRTGEIFNFPRIDRYKGEDYVSGVLEATEIEFSEIHAEYKTETRNSKGHRSTQWHTIFKGLYFIADFNKHFKGMTVVLPDVAERLFGFLGKALQKMNITRGELIKLEDPEFEKLFAVYGDDQIEARYILSPSLMKRISDFKKKTGKRIFLSFIHSNVHVAVETGKNMFEPRIFRTLLDFDMTAEYLQDLQFAVGIVDDLNLNTRIWTKE